MRKLVFSLALLLSFVSASVFAEGTGTLRVVIFSETAPFAGVKVQISETQPLPAKDDDSEGAERFDLLSEKVTDSFGAADFGLKQGAYWIRFQGENIRTKAQKVVVAAEESTQLVLTLLGKELRAEFELEQPEIKLNSDEVVASADQVTVKGVVLDSANDKPLAGARVFVPGSTQVFVADAKGEFTAAVSKKAPRISVIHKKYSSRTLEVDLSKETLRVELFKAGLQLQELVILAPSLEGSVAAFMEIRRKSSNVADVLGAEQISKAGDGDAASSLRRVTGLTLVKGKYVYIRGLGERYAATLLNDGTLPSPDPGRRIVPLDMFPAAILEGMVIQKSYSPELPGEFGGGSILLKTKGVPERFKGSFSTSIGFNDAADRHLDYRGGGLDWLGVDDGTRALPGAVKRATKNKKLEKGVNSGGFSEEELAEIGKSFPVNYNLEEERQVRSSMEDIPPSFSFSVGDLFKRGRVAMGYRTSLLYDPSVQNRVEFRQRVKGGSGSLETDDPQDYKRTQSEINTGATLDTGLQIGDNAEVSYTAMLLRKTQDTRQIQQGPNPGEDNQTLRKTMMEWVERQLYSQQVKTRLEFGSGVGEDKIKPGFKLRYGWSDAYRYQPDTRELTFVDRQDGAGFLLDEQTNGVSRTYAELNDKATDVGIDAVYPIKIFDNATQLKVGAARQSKKRVSETRRFNFINQQDNNIDLGNPDVDETLSRTNINESGFLPQENSLSTDDYSGQQTVDAVYGLVDTPIGSRFRVSVGGRWETSNQDVSTFNLLSATDTPVVAEHRTIDFLPVYSGTMFLTDRAQVRLAYSETINRPALRELSSAPFLDPDLGLIVQGNNLLVSSVIKHWDARWEYYLNREESVSFGAFAKEFKNPIESVIEQSSDSERRTYQNAKSASNYGLEAEFSKNLRFVGLKKWTLSANYAQIFSEVELDSASDSFQDSNRPLQGLSPWIANVQLFWEGKKTTAGLLYNAFGERIVFAGSQGLPDVVEQPIHQLDFITRLGLAKNTSVSLKVRNLLNQSVVLKQENFVVQRFDMGQSYSLGLSQTF